MGLFQSDVGWYGTDLNCCSRSRADIPLIVSGDDFGVVRLHRYPAIKEEAHWEFTGHGAFVVGCKFTTDAKRVITVGGGDRAIFQWRVTKTAPQAWINKQAKSRWQQLKDAIDAGTFNSTKD